MERIDTKVKNVVKSAGMFLNKHSDKIAICLFAVLVMNNVAFATAASAWTTFINIIDTWVTRLGFIAMLVGGIAFGFGFMQDQPQAKNAGQSAFIGGLITVAIVEAILAMIP